MGVKDLTSSFHLDAPVYLPIAKYVGLKNFQYEQRCRDFEMNMADCLEAYGFHKGRTECIAFMHDLKECMYGPKQQLRAEIVHGECMRRVLKGEREFEKIDFVPNFL